jgi:hypothetical protein
MEVKIRHVPDTAPDPPTESGPLRDTDHGCDPNRCERFFWIGALALGFLQAWGRRHESGDGLAYIGADSISYLDIGDAYMRGDFYIALNAMWSPFYSWLVGLALKLFRPSPFWEFTVVRLLNFLIYIFALFAFTYFLRALRRDYQSRNIDRRVPEWSWLVFGYTIFIWTSLLMNRVSRISPDLLVAALMFLACGLLLRLRMDASRWPLFVALGVVLGVGYLTKAIFFPLAFVFIAVVFLLIRRTVGNIAALLRTMLALLVFLTLAIPFIIALSQAKHRLTFGESARLNYAWYVNETRFTHWQGEPGSGTAAHPTRKIFESPAVYEFGGPPGVTYPPWYDPSYWYEGVAPGFSLRQQLRAIFRNLAFLYSFLYYRFFLVAIGMALFVLLYQSGPMKVVLGHIATYWLLLVPSLIGVGLYLLINVEPRYLAPFVPVIALSLFGGVRTSQTIEARRLLSGITFAVIIFFIVSIAPLTVRAGYSALRELSPGRAASRDVQWQVAAGLRQIGLQPGERIAVIGKPMFDAWPRLARTRVVAELPETAGNAERFWSADENIKQQVLNAFASTGARVIVADSVPQSARKMLGGTSSCWQRIGNTDHYACFLK